MRNIGRAAVVAVLCSGFGVGAYQMRDRSPVCDVSAARMEAKSAVDEREALVQRLAEREAELEALRGELRARSDDAFYEEALQKGIVDAVKRSGLPERQQRRVAVAIVREARANGIDPLLVVAVIRIESSFNNYAVSPVGAMGLMQLMPDTGKWLAQRRGSKLGRTTNLFDSELNIEMGTAYLSELIDQFGSVDKALVAYNAGPGMAQKILKSRTSRRKFLAGYPAKVIGEFHKLQHAAETRMAEQGNPPVPDGRG